MYRDSFAEPARQQKLQKGTLLSRGMYLLEHRIQRTGMAEVWYAYQMSPSKPPRPVVIKMIHPDLNGQEEARQRFLDEARFASKMEHPNIVKIFDFGEEKGLLYLVMEHIKGVSLDQLIKKAIELAHTIPLEVIGQLMVDVCKGLECIHTKKDEKGIGLNIVHRDISPHNLIISSDGKTKIIDFGIIKAKGRASKTRAGVLVGKLQYMSPEQLSPNEELDCRADIYMVGLVFYELLTLQSRFRGRNLMEVFFEALNTPPPKIVDLRPDCPTDLVKCVQTSLAIKKVDRFASAKEMQKIIERSLLNLNKQISYPSISRYLSHFIDAEQEKKQNEKLEALATQINRKNHQDKSLLLFDNQDELTIKTNSTLCPQLANDKTIAAKIEYNLIERTSSPSIDLDDVHAKTEIIFLDDDLEYEPREEKTQQWDSFFQSAKSVPQLSSNKQGTSHTRKVQNVKTPNSNHDHQTPYQKQVLSSIPWWILSLTCCLSFFMGLLFVYFLLFISGY